MSFAQINLANCKHSFISGDVCECLERRKCKYAYSYGGDVFCKHPSSGREGRNGSAGSVVSDSVSLCGQA